MSAELAEFIDRHERIFVLTGAGLSTASGIPDYRDERGAWKHSKPMEYRDFVTRHESRQRYWARSCIGWPRFGRALPNLAHHSLVRLESLGRVAATVTQNVDGLERRAGSRRVIELHGSLDSVGCLACDATLTRDIMQRRLLAANPELDRLSAELAPDGDARLAGFDTGDMRVPECRACGGILKPRVVFFGEAVPRARVVASFDALRQADAVLVLGSSLMVYSGFRFVREAARLGLPIAAVNRGITRADDLLDLKIEQDCGAALDTALVDAGPAQAEIA
ncbi:MAG TPA: NAD-dependent protein deacetylase [Gammaproteobacteria bacterium]|nr:NAD-dependent protein deacetylase [Gammaproteobacteria bacterium]